MSQEKSWHSTGFDGISKEEQRIASMSGPRRLWIPAGQGKLLALVDDEPFCVYEHNAKINGRWDNHHTCNEGFEDSCESCERLGKRSKAYTGYLTTVDCSEYIDKKGNKYQYEVKLIGGKLSQLKKWKRKKDDRGSLVGMWKVHREDDKKPVTGDEWEWSKAIEDQAKFFALANYKGKKLSEWWDKADANEEARKLLAMTFQLETGEDGKLVRVVPAFNYMEVLQPRGNQFVKDLLGGVTREEATGQTDDSTSTGGDGGGSEDDVPF